MNDGIFRYALDGKETGPMIGPGSVIHQLPAEGQFERAERLYKQLISIPDAFDPDTGRLNMQNRQAVILYELVVSAYMYASFPIYWSYERTPNTDGGNTTD